MIESDIRQVRGRYLRVGDRVLFRDTASGETSVETISRITDDGCDLPDVISWRVLETKAHGGRSQIVWPDIYVSVYGSQQVPDREEDDGSDLTVHECAGQLRVAVDQLRTVSTAGQSFETTLAIRHTIEAWDQFAAQVQGKIVTAVDPHGT